MAKRQNVASGRTTHNSERARRQRVRRRRRHRIFFTVVCAVLVVVAAVFATTVFFRVSTITISGETRYSEQQLVSASGVHDGDNLVLLDVKGITRSLTDAYPYLNEVKLHRRLPSTLQIEVSDRVPILSVENKDSYLLADAQGKLLDSVGAVEPGTVEVIGAEPQNLNVGDVIDEENEKLTTVLDMMTLLTKYGMNEDIVSIDISKAYDVRVQYADRYTILLGNMDELEHKIQFLLAILKEPSLPESGVIDLTDENEARYRPATESNESVVVDSQQQEQNGQEDAQDLDTDETAEDADETEETEDNTDASSETTDGETEPSVEADENDVPDDDGE